MHVISGSANGRVAAPPRQLPADEHCTCTLIGIQSDPCYIGVLLGVIWKIPFVRALRASVTRKFRFRYSFQERRTEIHPLFWQQLAPQSNASHIRRFLARYRRRCVLCVACGTSTNATDPQRLPPADLISFCISQLTSLYSCSLSVDWYDLLALSCLGCGITAFLPVRPTHREAERGTRLVAIIRPYIFSSSLCDPVPL